MSAGKKALKIIQSEEIIKILAPRSKNIDTQSPDGWTPIHKAAQVGNIEALKILMDYTDNPNAPTNFDEENGETPYEVAEWDDHFDVMELLSPYL